MKIERRMGLIMSVSDFLFQNKIKTNMSRLHSACRSNDSKNLKTYQSNLDKFKAANKINVNFLIKIEIV
jgi:hypothetical protein